MPDPHRWYEIRCPIHGFIKLNAWEREIMDQPAFQRLRRIRQLAWTDYIYPGATHTRFEHSLGVVHVVTLLYDAVVQNSHRVLEQELHYNEAGLKRDRQLVRLAALLHDVGHGPFSHAAEDLMPTNPPTGKRYKHEHYSAAIIRSKLKDVIENHPLNHNYGFKADDVASLLEGSSTAQTAILWRDLIDGQMDADRMDYFLRDSHHIGVEYGKFDLHRVVNTICAIRRPEGAGPRFGISYGGRHAAIGLVLARYFLFAQVYFHRTRIAYDIHLRGALREMLPGATFPPPTEPQSDDDGLDGYLKWDDWRVLGLLAQGKGGEHGERIATRNHYRDVFHTPECPKKDDLVVLENVRNALGKLVAAEETAERSWYKKDEDRDISVTSGRDDDVVVKSLSDYSDVIANMEPNNQTLIYVRPDDVDKARNIVSNTTGAKNG